MSKFLEYQGKMVVSGGHYCGHKPAEIVYPSVTIGTQIWMAANIADNIPGSYVYDDNEANRAIYGGLYPGELIPNIEALYPGWKVPATSDWSLLSTYLGNTVAGQKMKEAGTAHWTSPNNGTNESGFTGLPGGRWAYGYETIGEYAWFLASNHSGQQFYGAYLVKTDNYLATNFMGFEGFAYSVRLLKIQ